MLEHVPLLRGPALWMLGKRQPDQVTLDGNTFRVHSKDFGVTLELHSTGGYEEGTRRNCLEYLQPGMTFIDIGAHVGLYTISAAQRVGTEGRVFAFEPDDENRRLLEENLRVNGIEHVTVVPCGVCDRDGRLRLHRSPYNTGDHQLFYPGRGRRSNEIEVVRLDTFMQQQGGEVHLVKMDVQGAEARVITGMDEVMSGNRDIVLVVELSPWMLRDIGDDPVELLDQLVARGFELGTIDEGSGDVQVGDPASIMESCSERSYVNIRCMRPRGGENA